MKILGFMLVFLSSALCGLCFSSAKSERVNELRSFCMMLEMMQGEIADKLSPLPELTCSLSKKLEGKGGTFLAILAFNLAFLGQKDFDSIWHESLEACSPDLNEKEFESLYSLGKVLGRYNTETQSKAIEESLTVLRTSLSEESLELPQFKKLSVSVSMSVGALLAILLV